ncbi:MAG TPA: efflux RND transporter periplasmic adaptor subunit [Verrucomicrobiae bacterium]|jgi:RND family efflux transporter MFP subunit
MTIPLPSPNFRRWLATATALLALTFSAAAAENTTWVSGLTEAVDDATLSSSVIGIIRSRPFQEGARVNKGDVILGLDNRLEELEVVRKKLIRDHAKTELDRAKALAEKSDVSITKEELDKKRAEYEVAAADFDYAQEQLDRRKIVAPFSGIISEYHLKVGEGCQALQPLVRIVDPRRCHLVVYVDAQIGIRLKQGDEAQIEIESGRTMAPFRGQIDFVSPVADPASGLMKAKIVFENDGKIRPGVAGRMLLPKEPNAN